MKEVDILATWQPKEIFFTDYLKPKVRISLPSLEPFWSNTPWTKSLEEKKSSYCTSICRNNTKTISN